MKKIVTTLMLVSLHVYIYGQSEDIVGHFRNAYYVIKADSYSTSCETINSENCDPENITQIADCMMKKLGYDIDAFKRLIIEEDTFFIVRYKLHDTVI